MDVPFAYNRKEAKDHGEKGVLVGAPIKGKRVLLVDDVISAGTAIREAAGILKKEGAAGVAGIAVAMDRQEKTGKETKTGEHPRSAIQQVEVDLGTRVVSIVCLDDLLGYAERCGAAAVEKYVDAISEYRAKWGVAK